MNKLFNLLIFPLFFLFFSLTAYGQSSKYLVYFSDKKNNQFSVNKPEAFLSQKAIKRRRDQNISITKSDLPVSQSYIDSLKARNAKIWYKTKWLNGAVIKIDTVNIDTITNLPFVTKIRNLLEKEYNLDSSAINSEVEKKDNLKKCKDNSGKYGDSFAQNDIICTDNMHNKGYHGEDILIALMDAGYKNVPELSFFDHLFKNNNIKGTFDFVEKDSSVYEDHSHGTGILSVIAGYEEDRIIGTAYKSDLLLFRTEDVDSEYKIEEVNWLIAAEKADSMGVDIINTSLGYSTFDNPAHNIKKFDLDGKGSIISRAASIATRKGIVCVLSAGNEGDKDWKYITPPGDIDSALTVGAVNENGQRAEFSSVGPTSDGRIKPDVMGLGDNAAVGKPGGNIGNGNGSSFAAPMIAGLVAGFWQAYPGLTNYEVIDYIKASGNNVTNPDTLIGYGIPCFTRAIKLKENIPLNTRNLNFNNPLTDENLKIFVNKLKSCQSLSVYVFDVHGKRILSDYLPEPSIDHDISISTKNLKPGTYFLHIISEERIKVKAVKLE